MWIASKVVVFKIKTGYKLELLSEETKKLLGSTKWDIHKDKKGENVPELDNIVNNIYQQASKVLFTSVSDIGQLFNISPHSLIMPFIDKYH